MATDRLELLLHHTHLPKLDSAGVLDYRATDRTVARFGTDAFAQLSTAAESLTDADADADADVLAAE